LYRQAISTSAGGDAHLEAMCWKNLGTAIEQEGNQPEANSCYELAIQLEPQQMEAHMALGMASLKAGELESALEHFDEVIWSADEINTLTARGHRVDIFFRLEMTDKAFDDISVLLPHGTKFPWIFPWCAKLVCNYVRTNDKSLIRAIRFWDAFVKLQPKDRLAQKERLLCLVYAKIHGQRVGITYEHYLADVSAFIVEDATDAAYLWDRVGHWAQVDNNWEKAEEHYRKAYDLEPARYGYCLGTALNFLERYNESLPILLDQATIYQPDASSWFQVALAQEKLGNVDECKESYRHAMALDPDHASAAFNLGGVYWNTGPMSEALTIWAAAIMRFPSYPQAEKLRQELPHFFGGGNEETT
jgi:tetratricopeptide (TPR) repeat protein